ncbi:MAG: cupin domain-containing protein [Actinomycetia bacterium]|nr:cupin domain-containing protein [Actinomycetes bacterium]
MNIVESIIEEFNMKQLPGEGGYYVETYRCKEIIDKCCLSKVYKGSRNISTAILYLITPEHFSHLHRLKSDEIFHFYSGDPVYMLNLFEDGTASEVILGQDIWSGQKMQHVVPRDCWQGACLKPGGSYALLGTTVAPGYDSSDYQNSQGFKKKLIEKYPRYRDGIEKLI